MECKRNVVTITLTRLNYLVYYLGNYVDDTPTETSIKSVLSAS